MIAYIGKDGKTPTTWGGHRLALDIFERRIGTTNAQIINNLTVDIVNNSYGTDSIAMSPEVSKTSARETAELRADLRSEA